MEVQLVVVEAVCNVEIVFDLHHFHGLHLFGSGRQCFRQAVEVYLIRCLSIQARVRAVLVEELDVATDAAAS